MKSIKIYELMMGILMLVNIGGATLLAQRDGWYYFGGYFLVGLGVIIAIGSGVFLILDSLYEIL